RWCLTWAAAGRAARRAPANGTNDRITSSIRPRLMKAIIPDRHSKRLGIGGGIRHGEGSYVFSTDGSCTKRDTLCCQFLRCCVVGRIMQSRVSERRRQFLLGQSAHRLCHFGYELRKYLWLL